MPRPLAPALALVVASSLALGVARAEPATPSAPSDAEVARRLTFVEARLALREPAAARFWYGWLSAFGALTTAQAALAIATTSRDFRVDRAVGAVTSSLGVIPLGVLPLPGVGAPAVLAALPAGTPLARRSKLARGERLLERSASEARLARSWVAHVLGGLVCVGSGLTLMLAYDRVGSGALSIGAGVAVTELQIGSRPTGPIDDWDDYRALVAGHAPRARAAEPTWSITPAGLGAIGRF